MSELSKEELLNYLEQAHRYFTYEPPGKDEQAYQQIKEMIKKPEVTEEWIEEKAKEMVGIISNYCFSVGKLGKAPSDAMKFIRSLFEEIQ